jgi:REP element-mobilizing transposase RayT
MPRYLRAHIEGGVFFFTVTLADRSSDVLVRHVDRLRRIYASVQKRYPFETIAICVLPDHLHAIWSLPEGDADFPLRWNLIKAGFSRGLAGNRPRTASKMNRRERGASLLGARYSKRWRLGAPRRLHSLQSGEARACFQGLRLAAQQLSSLCCEGSAAGGLGR